MTNIERIIAMKPKEVTELIEKMVECDSEKLDTWWCLYGCPHKKICNEYGGCRDETKFKDIVTAFLESEIPLE